MVNGSSDFNAPNEIDNFAITVGLCYTSVGVVFIFLQLMCAYLIHKDKGMKNATYELVAMLSVVDAVELSAIGLYAGITVIFDVQYPMLDRWVSFVCLSAWWHTTVLLPIIAFSRWVAITRAHLVQHMFT